MKSILIALDSGEAVSFSDGGDGVVEKNPADVLRGMMKSSVPIIPLFELSAPDKSTFDFADKIERDEDAIRDRMDEAREQGRDITASQAASEIGIV